MQALWDARCLHGTRTQTLATAFAAEDTHCLWMAAANHKTKQKLAPKLAPDWIKQCGTEWIRTAARLRLSPTKSGAIAQTSTSRDGDNRITGLDAIGRELSGPRSRRRAPCRPFSGRRERPLWCRYQCARLWHPP